MVTLEGLVVNAVICLKIEVEHWTHNDVGSLLQSQYPSLKGLSSRSIRQFCKKHNIHATSRLSQKDLARVVATTVGQEPVCSCVKIYWTIHGNIWEKDNERFFIS